MRTKTKTSIIGNLTVSLANLNNTLKVKEVFLIRFPETQPSTLDETI